MCLIYFHSCAISHCWLLVSLTVVEVKVYQFFILVTGRRITSAKNFLNALSVLPISLISGVDLFLITLLGWIHLYCLINLMPGMKIPQQHGWGFVNAKLMPRPSTCVVLPHTAKHEHKSHMYIYIFMFLFRPNTRKEEQLSQRIRLSRSVIINAV